MGSQDVAFLLSEANFPNAFVKNGGTGESLGTTTCPKTMAGVTQGHAPCKILSLS